MYNPQTPKHPKPKRWIKRLLAILHYQSSPSKRTRVIVFHLLWKVIRYVGIKSPETIYAPCHCPLPQRTEGRDKKQGIKRSQSNNHNNHHHHNHNNNNNHHHHNNKKKNKNKNKNKTVRNQKQERQQNDYDGREHQPQEHVGSWPLVFSITFSIKLCAQAETHLLLRAKKMPVLSIALSSLTIMWTCKQWRI